MPAGIQYLILSQKPQNPTRKSSDLLVFGSQTE